VVRQRWWLLVATLLLVSGAASGLRFLSFNNDTRAFFSEENPQLQALEDLEETYDKRTAVFFAIAPGDGDVFTRETLSALEELTKAAWEMPHADRVSSRRPTQNRYRGGGHEQPEEGIGGEKSCLGNRETRELRGARRKAAPEFLRDVDQVRGGEQDDPRADEGLRDRSSSVRRGSTSRRAA